MIPIIVSDLLDIPAFQEEWPDFKSVDNCTREKIVPDMEVRLRRSQEPMGQTVSMWPTSMTREPDPGRRSRRIGP